MRPDVLNRGYKPATKLLFAAIRLFSGRPLPDAAKLVFYPPGLLRRSGETLHPAGDARALGLVRGRPGADGRRRIPGQRVRLLHRGAHRAKFLLKRGYQ